MALRKQFLNVPAPDPDLVAMLDRTRDHVLTDNELREQRVSFAFGNALDLDRITRASVQQASQTILLNY